MDRTTIRAVEDLTKMGLDTDAGALVLLQCDGPAASGEARRCASAFEAHGASYIAETADRNEGDLLLAARRSALPALERLGSTLLDDVAVPTPSIPALIARIETVAATHRVVIGTFGHAGDGNLHPTLVYDPSSPKSKAAVLAAFDEIVRAALDLGGTITGEHGVGALKQPYLADMIGPTERALMHRIKDAFDPTGILNPGRAI
jgi:D-lactate dehydrogenase (cytochrome)/glycolate oxidase